MQIVMFLLAALEKVPATFWGVVIGSFFSILGVSITNRASDKRLHAQFQHELEQRAKERAIEVKKNIYLDAVAALALGLRTLGNMSDVYQPDEKLLGPVRDTENYAVMKVLVVASADTGRAFGKLNEGIKAGFAKLYPRRVELILKKQQLDACHIRIEGAAKEQDQILEQMKQKNLAGDVDQTSWGVLRQMFDAAGQRSLETSDRRNQLFKQLTAEQLEFGRECMRVTSELSRRFVPVLSHLRLELDLPVDVAVLQELVQDDKETVLAMEEAAKKFASMLGLDESPTASGKAPGAPAAGQD